MQARDARPVDLFGAAPEQDYPSRPGWHGLSAPARATSRAAGCSVEGEAKAIRGRIFAELASVHPGALSSDEIAGRLGLLKWSVRPRIAELQAAGQVIPSGETVRNETGRAAQTWRAVMGTAASAAPEPVTVAPAAPARSAAAPLARSWGHRGARDAV